MAKLDTIAIVHPESPGERLNMNMKDFDPTIHILWAEPSDLTIAEPDAPTETIDPVIDLPEESPGLVNPPIPPTIEEIESMGWRAVKAYCQSIGLEGKGDESWEQFLIKHLYP